jgi:hypothetical protein
MCSKNWTLLLITLAVATPAASQELPFPRCPTPHANIEEFQERLVGLSEGPGHAIANLVSEAFSPNLGHRCPLLDRAISLPVAMDAMTRWVARSENGWLERGFFMGLTEGLRLDPAMGPPMDALAFAIEEGATDHGRDFALWTVMTLASQSPEALAYIVARAREPGGPSVWPDLPQAIARRAYLTPRGDRYSEVRAALEANVEGIGNDTVRCWVERGGLPSEGPRPPGQPPACP